MPKFTPFFISAVYMIPNFVVAQNEVTSLQDLFSILGVVINWSILTVIVPLALLFFLWGLAKFILNSGDEKKQTAGKQTMLWGIIILTVMVGVWGIVRILQIAVLGDSFINEPPF